MLIYREFFKKPIK